MNRSEDDWLNNTPFNDDVWLCMLVDNELSVSQRKAYIAYLREANGWQKVATAFLDEQMLSGHLTEQVTMLAVNDDISSVKGRASRGWTRYLAMAACLLFGLMIGPTLHRGEPVVEIVDTPRPSQPNADEVSGRSGAAFGAPLPGLYQISDTVDEAVYYADFSLPQFMLDALVLAGHRVTFDQEFLGYTETSDNPAAVPINVIHIQKYARLLAAVE